MSSAMYSGDVQPCFVGIDPGKRKCGIAVVDLKGRILFQKTVCLANLVTILEYVASTYSISTFAMGDGTGSDGITDVVNDIAAKSGAKIRIVTEKDTTQEGSRLAFASGSLFNRTLLFFRLLTGIDSLDSWAAVVIAKRAVDYSPKKL